ncbi:glycosyltransferase family 4 protein [Chondromyces apiculatus]|nr:glycosyltransferase family 4 protein [Chondromyces apiculatus]
MKPRLLAIVPDPDGAFAQAGGVLSATRAVLGPEVRAAFEVDLVDTTMRAFPKPDLRERLTGAARRGAEVAGHIARHRPDVAVAFCSEGTSFYEKSSLLLLAKAAGARTFLSPRSGRAEAWLQRSAAARRWVAQMGGAIDGFLVQSEGWRQVYAAAGVPGRKLHVWPNTVDTAAWAPIAAARRDPGVPRGRPFRFLFLGWAIEAKGLGELRKAVEVLAARPGPPFELAVAGDGAAGEALRKEAGRGRLPRAISLLGWVKGEARDRELARADALVLPTHVDGFPNVILEAMACGLPVIATPVGAIPDVVVSGETGLLVPVREVESLVAAMDRLRRHPEETRAMGRAGLDRVRSRFDRALGVARLVSLLQGHGDVGGGEAGGAQGVNVGEAGRSQEASS